MIAQKEFHESLDFLSNSYVEQLFKTLQDHGEDTSGLTAIMGHIQGMESFIRRAENQLGHMQSQLDVMKEIRRHPIKTALENAIKTLSAMIADIKAQLSEIKGDFIMGCKNAVEAIQENSVIALDKLASFFHVKTGLLDVNKSMNMGIRECEKMLSKIDTFSQEYHATGLHLKNLGRVLSGKDPISQPKAAGKLSNAISAPYRAEVFILKQAKESVNEALRSLSRLEKRAEVAKTMRDERKKPSILKKIEANKSGIARQTRETPLPTRKKQGAEL